MLMTTLYTAGHGSGFVKVLNAEVHPKSDDCRTEAGKRVLP
jgi:hypothetical protein